MSKQAQINTVKTMKLVKYTIAAEIPASYKHKAGTAFVQAYAEFRTAQWAVSPAFATLKLACIALVSEWLPAFKSAMKAEKAEDRDALLAKIPLADRKKVRKDLVQLLLSKTEQKELKGGDYQDRSGLDVPDKQQPAVQALGYEGKGKSSRAVATILSDVSRVMGAMHISCNASTKGSHAATAKYVAMAAALLKPSQEARKAGIPVLPTDPAKAISILRAMATAIGSGKVEGFENFKATAAK